MKTKRSRSPTLAGKKPESSKSVRRRPLKIRRILVPLDGSGHALKALHYAIYFARQSGAEIETIRVVEPTVYPEGNVIPTRSQDPDAIAMATARAHMREIGSRMIPEGIPWKNKVMMGVPYHEIVEYAHANKVDLLIVTTHGYSGLKHFFLGSDAEKIVRHAPCPVLVVRDKEHDFVSQPGRRRAK